MYIFFFFTRNVNFIQKCYRSRNYNASTSTTTLINNKKKKKELKKQKKLKKKPNNLKYVEKFFNNLAILLKIPIIFHI